MKKYTYIIFLVILITGKSFSQTANWSAVLPAKFPTNASGQIHGISRVSQLKFHPTDPNKMYAVSARGGLFISTDAGTNWTVTPGTDFMAYARLASVCVDHTNDQIIYLGTGDHNYYYSGNGVMKSTNGGQTFTQTTLTGKLVVDMIMDPNDNNVIVAATNSGIYKTTNAGSTWALKTASRAMDDLKQKSPISRVLYAAGKDSSFFLSTDFGDTWSQITNGIVLPAGFTNGNGVRLALTPADTNVVYLGMVVNGGTIYKSIDGGNSFSAIKTTASPYLTYYSNASNSSGQGDYNFGIGVDRNDANILYLVAHNNWKSTDGGITWTQLTNWWQKCHTDMHQIITSPYNNNNLYNMNDGGVWLSTDGGNNWTPKSDGIYGYEIYHGNCSPTRKDMFSIGTQDNGELYATTLGWFCNRGGDWGSQCAFDYRTNSSMVYYYGSNKRRLVNGGESTYGLPAQATILHDIAFHRSNPDLAFVADSIIYRTTNLTASTPAWTQIYSTGKKIMSMHCAFGNANRLYIITNDQMIYVSNNALSANPTFVSYALPNTTNNRASITSIKSNPDVVYITCNTKSYRSSDGGATWVNITYNLPGTNHIKILADEFSPSNELVFIATGNTVYYKIANANIWTIYNTSLPTRTDAIDMSIYNDSTPNSSLRFATYGRGMWETPITNLRALNANFIADNTNPCNGAAVNFTDLSTGAVTARTWTFTGGTPATSTLQNPVVTYAGNGSFNVTLNVTDGITNNSLTRTNYINTNGSNLPMIEGFEGIADPPAGWTNIDNGTAGDKWTKVSTASGYGNSIYSMMFDNYSWNIPGEKDELRTMRLDLNSYNSAKLTFDVAYQVFSGYSDTLAVLVSTDCGNTFTKVYAKGGATLSSAGSGGNNFVPTSSQWRTDTILLNVYLNQNILVQFQNINGYGNKLYIDNINLNATVAANAGADKNICGGSSATIGSAAASGISYAWSPATGLSSSTLSNPTASPAATTTYVLTATQTSSGIFSKDTVVVNVDVINISISNSSPCGGNNGSATASVSSGVAPFTYLWSNGNTTASISNLSSGSYSLTVTDASGCVKNTFTYLQPITPPAITLNPTPTSCGLNNGSITSSISGGLYLNYLWSNGATTSSISNLASGVYTLTVTSGGCSATSSATINSSGAISVSLIPTNTTCGLDNGSINSTATGGVNYSYLWSNGETISAISNLASGVYTLTVTSGGCSATSSATINSSGAISVSLTPTNTTCGLDNGSINSTATGGVNYSYLWSNGETISAINNLASGVYTLTVTSGGCSATSSTIVNASNSISVALTPTNTTCGLDNGSINSTATGGVNYSYLWSNGETISAISNLASGVYTLTVISGGCSATSSTIVNASNSISVALTPTNTTCGLDNGSINSTATGGVNYSYLWSNGETTSLINNLANGVYTITVSSLGCTATSSSTIALSTVISTSLISSNPTCSENNGYASLAVSNGVPPYNYLWSNGATTNSIINLGAGTYSVVITDATGCIANTSVVMIASGSVPAKPLSISGQINAVCAGSSNVNYSVPLVNGATSYNWTAPANATIVSGLGTNSVLVNFNSSFVSGTLSVSAVNYCGASLARTTFIRSIPAMPGAISGPTSVCANQTNVAYSIVPVVGATTYTWSKPAGATILTGQGTPSITVKFKTTAGQIKVKVGNACGFTVNKTLAVSITCRESADDLKNISELNVYPNPTNDVLHINYYSAVYGFCKIEMYDLTGRLVVSSTQNALPDFNETELNLENLSPGVYTLMLALNGEKVIRKIAVQ